MNLWFLIETNNWTPGRRVVAACTSVESAIKMMEEWFNDELNEKSEYEEVDSKFVKNGQYSYAEIRSKSNNAYEDLDIFEAWTNDWLNDY